MIINYSSIPLRKLSPVIQSFLKDVNKDEKLLFYCSDSWRSYDEQFLHFLKGRSCEYYIVSREKSHIINIYDIKTIGSTVTNALPLESYHNYGLSVDLVPLDKNKNVSWDKSLYYKYDDLIPLANKYNLEWGKSFGDYPHFQDSRFILPKFENNSSLTSDSCNYEFIYNYNINLQNTKINKKTDNSIIYCLSFSLLIFSGVLLYAIKRFK